MEDSDRDALVYQAKLAEQAERYDDMVKAISKVVHQGFSLTPEERNLLSVAYKNVIGARRSAWRTISTRMEDSDFKKDPVNLVIAKEYRAEIEKELASTCAEILAVLDDYLIKKAIANKDDESKVFYRKMKGDYYRYMAEFYQFDKKKEMSELSLAAYKEASEDANPLPTTHPIRLGLALNFSVFYYEILNKQDKACTLAKKTFDEAIAELDQVNEESYKDSTLILQLLRDNLTLWTSEVDGDGAVEDTIQDIEDKQES